MDICALVPSKAGLTKEVVSQKRYYYIIYVYNIYIYIYIYIYIIVISRYENDIQVNDQDRGEAEIVGNT